MDRRDLRQVGEQIEPGELFDEEITRYIRELG